VALLARTPITPNQVTALACLLGAAAGLAVAVGAHRPVWRLVSAGLLFLSVVFDCCDGQLARLRGISSTTGAILDGISDYVVGFALGIGGSYYMVVVCGSPWYWLVGLAGIASSAVQAALFDHNKTRYIARVGGGYREREEDLGQVARDRRAAWQAGRYREALLLRVYESYSRAQHAAQAIPPAADPAAWRAANAGRMRAWATLGIGTHFALAYVASFLAFWWAPAPVVYFVLCATALNLLLLVMLALPPRPAHPAAA
jgi:phosphatidylglycerophosphate synthase